jgi:NAD(P)-dependent dehydrogenase (short-subunit alcohol dehydrogenase family)
MSILITGSGELTQEIVKALDGQEIYRIHPKAESPEQLAELGKYWLDYDLQEPQHVVLAVQDLVGVTLSAVIHAGSEPTPVDWRAINPFDLQREFMANVFAPLMLTKWLLDFDILPTSGRVIFFTDSRFLGSGFLAYYAAKGALVKAADCFLSQFPRSLSVNFLEIREPIDTAAQAATIVKG